MAKGVEKYQNNKQRHTKITHMHIHIVNVELDVRAKYFDQTERIGLVMLSIVRIVLQTASTRSTTLYLLTAKNERYTRVIIV